MEKDKDKIDNKISNLVLIAQMIDAAEKNITSAKQMLREMMGGPATKANLAAFSEKAQTLTVSEGGKVIEGVFDGQNMVGPDKKQYPVPANYASKSKLVEGDVLKLTIADDGSFIYKQIGPVDRKKMLGMLMVDEKGDFRVMAEGKPYKVLLASLTYFKAEAGDEVTIVVPQEGATEWAAVENVIKKGSHSLNTDIEMGENSGSKVIVDEDEEL
ncbi:MAG: hypothetical protein P4L74_06055 [Candidatus Doudnabacteria bacterium]|nr:hypothetical protein [Candidatus Doudnabacteria bacterium]